MRSAIHDEMAYKPFYFVSRVVYGPNQVKLELADHRLKRLLQKYNVIGAELADDFTKTEEFSGNAISIESLSRSIHEYVSQIAVEQDLEGINAVDLAADICLCLYQYKCWTRQDRPSESKVLSEIRHVIGTSVMSGWHATYLELNQLFESKKWAFDRRLRKDVRGKMIRVKEFVSTFKGQPRAMLDFLNRI